MNKECLSLKDLVNSEELAELNVDELMEVQGGMDFDEDSDGCDGGSQCPGPGAVVVYCSGSGGVKP